MIVLTKKLDFKMKNLKFINGHVYNDDGEYVDLMADLEKVFGGDVFDISVTNSVKSELSVDDFDS